MPFWLIPIFIFLLRICDVSIGTIRVIYTIRGNRLVSAILGAIESAIWIVAISQVVKYVSEPLNIAAWALGFASGNVVGITLEKWIATGHVMVRLISLQQSGAIRDQLRSQGFGVTSVAASGKDGPVNVLFIVAPRRRAARALETIRDLDESAFLTIEPVSDAFGGVVPTAASAIRK